MKHGFSHNQCRATLENISLAWSTVFRASGSNGVRVKLQLALAAWLLRLQRTPLTEKAVGARVGFSPPLFGREHLPHLLKRMEVEKSWIAR